MGVWRIKNKEIRSKKNFRKAEKDELKIGDTYYWNCPHRQIITKELIYDKFCVSSNINSQIEKGLIYIKK